MSVTGGAEPEATDSVAGLVDKSMLVAHVDTAPTRFTMLETLRAYGRERLAERGEDVAACLAHACYHAELAETSGIGLRGPEEASWAEALAAVLDDLRSSHGPGSSRRRSATPARSRGPTTPSVRSCWTRAPTGARQALDRAVVAAGAARNRFVLGVALVSAGSLHTRHGDPAQAARLLGEAVDHWSQAGNWTQQWITLRNVIDLLIRLDGHEQAAVLYGALTASGTATPAYGADADRLVTHAAVLRRELGAGRFSAAIAHGAALGDEGTIPFASMALSCRRSAVGHANNIEQPGKRREG